MPDGAGTAARPFCPECELRELQAQIDAESIGAAVAKMAYVEGVTTPEGTYRKRLAVCAACPSLRSGILCAECGSYVAFRARILGTGCPYPQQNKWSNI